MLFLNLTRPPGVHRGNAPFAAQVPPLSQAGIPLKDLHESRYRPTGNHQNGTRMARAINAEQYHILRRSRNRAARHMFSSITNGSGTCRVCSACAETKICQLLTGRLLIPQQTQPELPQAKSRKCVRLSVCTGQETKMRYETADSVWYLLRRGPGQKGAADLRH